jgi:UDP:flavonoid glycosyltransferase YjiC (YdhE family)
MKVRKVLSDPSYTISARQASEKLRTYGGATEAAYLIENFSSVETGHKKGNVVITVEHNSKA